MAQYMVFLVGVWRERKREGEIRRGEKVGAGGEKEKRERERENKSNCDLKQLHIKIIGDLINCFRFYILM